MVTVSLIILVAFYDLDMQIQEMHRGRAALWMEREMKKRWTEDKIMDKIWLKFEKEFPDIA